MTVNKDTMRELASNYKPTDSTNLQTPNHIDNILLVEQREFRNDIKREASHGNLAFKKCFIQPWKVKSIITDLNKRGFQTTVTKETWNGCYCPKTDTYYTQYVDCISAEW
jgi:hypothetical protein